MTPSIAAGLAAASTLVLFVAVRLRSDRVVIERAAAERADADGRRRAWNTYPALVLCRLGSISLPPAVCDRERLRRRLRLSRSIGVDVDHVVGVKLAAAAVAFLACLVTPIAAAAPALAAAAFTLPDVVLARRVVRRTARMDDELPQLLDLLAAASHAGLGGPLALRRAVDGIRGPLADELGLVLTAVDLGGRWREELRAAADRLELPDLQRAVTALSRTETLGSSLSDAITELASRVRDARRAAMTERARKAPVKMLFPLVFLVLPAFLLLTVVPVLLSTLRSIR
jgi:Flp pilus assembly protein TadB